MVNNMLKGGGKNQFIKKTAAAKTAAAKTAALPSHFKTKAASSAASSAASAATAQTPAAFTAAKKSLKQAATAALEEECLKKMLIDLTNELAAYITPAEDNKMLYLNEVSGFVWGDNQILYTPTQHVKIYAMNGQGNQATVTNTGATLLIEQRIPFKLIVGQQLEVGSEKERIASFIEKNGMSSEISGKLAAAFLLDMLLNISYNLPSEKKQEIKRKLFEIGICKPINNTNINWTNLSFLLMPGVYTDMENSKSLKMTEVSEGGTKKTKKQRKTKKRRKTKRRKTTKKRRKSTKR